MAIAKLSIDLEARFAQFEKGLERAAALTEKNAQRIDSAFGVMRAAVGGLVAGVGLAGLRAFTQSTIDSIDALNDLKDATGASIENISALEDLAMRTGTSMDTVGSSLIKFNAALKDAAPGSQLTAAFDAIGLSVADLRRLDPAEALRQTAVALSQFADDGDKARLTQELFGKSLREVAPFLNDLATQTQLQATVTAEAALEAEKFNKQLFALEAAASQAARALVGPVVSGLNSLIAKFEEGRKAGDDFIVTLLKQTEIARLLGLGGAGKGFDGTGRNSGLAALTGSTEISGGSSDRSAARLLRQGKLGVGDIFGVSSKGGSKGGGRTAAQDLRDTTTELDRYLVNLQRQLDATLQLTEVQKAQIRISEAGAQGFSEAQRNEILRLAERIDKERELAAVLEEQRREQDERIRIGRQLAIEQGVDNSARAESLQRLLGATPTAELERTRADMLLLTEEFEAGRLSEERYLEAVSARLGITNEKLEKTKSLADDLGLTFASAFEDAVIGGKKLSDVIGAIGQDILRITLRKTVTEPLGNFLTGALGNLLSFDGGGSTGSGPRAGGLDGRGGFLAMLHPEESVIDHTRGQSGQSVQVVINQTVGDVATVDMLRRNSQDLVRTIQAGISRSITRGGALA
jgi:hypothetical protein